MMKAHGIAPNAASIRGSPSARSVKVERPDVSTPAAKKRKADSFANDHAAEDDQEQFDNIKPDPGNGVELLQVKEEPGTGAMHVDNHQDLVPFMASLSAAADQSMDGNSYIPRANHYMQARESHGDMYGMQAMEAQPVYINLPFFGHMNTDGAGNSANQLGSSQDETILID